MRDLLSELRYALRVLTRTPAVTLPAVASLALGIALNTTLFSVVSAALLRPLGAPGSDDLVRIGRSPRGEAQFRSLTYDELTFIRRHAATLADVIGGQTETVSLARPDGAEMLSAEVVTSNYFSMLGVVPAVGRGFIADPDRGWDEGAGVVISDRLWRRVFGADPAVVGRGVSINNVPFAVIGVAPAGFHGANAGFVTDVWLPASMSNAIAHRTGGLPSMHLIGRLERGVSLAAARAELDVLADRIAEAEASRDRNRRFAIAPARGVHPGLARPLSVFLLLLMAVVAVVLLIACANVASLLLARGSARRGEIGVRLALGASRGRIVRHLLVESVLLALAGGAFGLLLSVWPVGALNAIFSVAGPGGAPTFLDFRLDWRVLLFTTGATLLTALVFGAAPALQATRVDLISTLKDSSSQSGAARARWRGGLAAAQMAVSFVLVAGAMLLFRSLHNSATIDVGFDPDPVAVVSFDDLRTYVGYDPARTERFYEALLTGVRALPRVEGAALANFIPMGQNGGTMILTVPAWPADAELTVPVGTVSDGFFATLGQRLIRGRDFTAADRRGAPRVAIVNEAAMRRLWPSGDPIGKRIALGEDSRSGRLPEAEHVVVGVVRNARYASLAGEIGPFVYVPAFPGGRVLHVRSAAPAGDTLSDITRLARALEPNLPCVAGRSMREAMAASLVPARIVQVVLGVAAAIALLLASGGLYGLVCYTVQQRLKEIGIRVALGASRRDIFGALVGGTMRLTAIGLVIGAAIAALAMRLLSTFLFGLTPTDPSTFGGTAAVLVIVTLAAGYAAARKALDIDPMAVLRHE